MFNVIDTIEKSDDPIKLAELETTIWKIEKDGVTTEAMFSPQYGYEQEFLQKNVGGTI